MNSHRSTFDYDPLSHTFLHSYDNTGWTSITPPGDAPIRMIPTPLSDPHQIEAQTHDQQAMVMGQQNSVPDFPMQQWLAMNQHPSSHPFPYTMYNQGQPSYHIHSTHHAGETSGQQDGSNVHAQDQHPIFLPPPHRSSKSMASLLSSPRSSHLHQNRQRQSYDRKQRIYDALHAPLTHLANMSGNILNDPADSDDETEEWIPDQDDFYTYSPALHISDNDLYLSALPERTKRRNKAQRASHGLLKARLGILDVYHPAHEVVLPTGGHTTNENGIDGENDEIVNQGNDSLRLERHVPPDAENFRKIDLFRDNPDNHQHFMDLLNSSSLPHEKHAIKSAKQYEKFMQVARALGWLTSGRFGRKGWSKVEQMRKSPAVHAVYADTYKKGVVLFSKKEQDQREDAISHAQDERERNQQSFSVDEFKGFKSKKEYMQYYDHDLQQLHDTLEDAQIDRYYDEYVKGKLPRLHLDEERGVFRLTKSKVEQQKTRLYSQQQLDAELDDEKREKMKEEDREKHERLGIVGVMGEVESSSDEEYQQHRTTRKAPQHYSIATYPAIPHSHKLPYDPSRQWRRTTQFD